VFYRENVGEKLLSAVSLLYHHCHEDCTAPDVYTITTHFGRYLCLLPDESYCLPQCLFNLWSVQKIGIEPAIIKVLGSSAHEDEIATSFNNKRILTV
jgi:hypothetical protein